MTPPTGYVHALFAGHGVVKAPDITTDTGVFIPGAVLGHGDIHIVSECEAWESTNWTPCNEGGTALPESASPLLAPEPDPEPDPEPEPTQESWRPAKPDKPKDGDR